MINIQKQGNLIDIKGEVLGNGKIEFCYLGRTYNNDIDIQKLEDDIVNLFGIDDVVYTFNDDIDIYDYDMIDLVTWIRTLCCDMDEIVLTIRVSRGEYYDCLANYFNKGLIEYIKRDNYDSREFSFRYTKQLDKYIKNNKFMFDNDPFLKQEVDIVSALKGINIEVINDSYDDGYRDILEVAKTRTLKKDS